MKDKPDNYGILHLHKNILMNYLEYLTIKLFGVAITFLIYGLLGVGVLSIGTKEIQYPILPMVN
jgi:hypothetical protein